MIVELDADALGIEGLAGQTYEKGCQTALRGHISGSKPIVKGQGLHPGNHAGTPNHDALGYEVYYAGDPVGGLDPLVDFFNDYWINGFFTSQRRDEWASRSHEFLHLTSFACGVQLGRMAGHQKLIDTIFRLWRSWMRAAELHKGRKGGNRYPFIDWAYARDAGDSSAVGNARIREMFHAVCAAGVRPPVNLASLDMTGLWTIKNYIPRQTLDNGLAGWSTAPLPLTHAKHRTVRWSTGHQCECVGGDTGAALAPAMWLRCEYPSRQVTTGSPPDAGKYTTVPPAVAPPAPATPEAKTTTEFPSAT